MSHTIPKTDLKIERIRGTGPGGQHRNKTASCVRITHLPTGIVVKVDERSQHTSLKKAMRELERRLFDASDERAAALKKADRDRKVKAAGRVRTYDQTANRVTDHRTNLKRQFNETVRGRTVQDFLEGFLADL